MHSMFKSARGYYFALRFLFHQRLAHDKSGSLVVIFMDGDRRLEVCYLFHCPRVTVIGSMYN